MKRKFHLEAQSVGRMLQLMLKEQSLQVWNGFI